MLQNPIHKPRPLRAIDLARGLGVNPKSLDWQYQLRVNGANRVEDMARHTANLLGWHGPKANLCGANLVTSYLDHKNLVTRIGSLYRRFVNDLNRKKEKLLNFADLVKKNLIENDIDSNLWTEFIRNIGQKHEGIRGYKGSTSHLTKEFDPLMLRVAG